MSSKSMSNVESNVVSNVESKVVLVRLSKFDLEFLGKKYNFEVEEALRYLSEEKSKKSEKPKILVAKYPMPFNGEKDENCCNGVVKNHGLYTQCRKKVKGYCKSCEGQPYGNIDDRVKIGLYEYKDPKGKGPKRYLDVLKSLKISKETVEEEMKSLNITINPIHFEEAGAALENVKRGRPKTEKKVKEATGKKGRPKKEKKTVEVNEELEEEDLFATLIANAQKSQNVEAMVEEVVNEVVVVNNLETESLSNEDTKEVEKQKKAKKVKEVDPAKEIEKQKKAEEKATKEAEKQKKAEEKATKEAEKQKKAEEKATKVEEEADVVTKFEFGGKSYYKSKKSGVIYNMEQEVVGKWNSETNDIDFEEEEEEEEYDD
jgi:chemotaxis protein histidine kinase CheA